MTAMDAMNFQNHIIYLLVAMFLSGCSLPFLGAEGQSSEEFAHYVEGVFKLQNGLSSQMMALADSDEKPKNATALAKAEQTMQKECEPLNEYASRDTEGLTVDLVLKTRVAQSAKACETAAKALQALLAVH